MSRKDLIIPRTFLAPVGSSYFFLLSDRCETKASVLALFYFLSQGEINRASALAFRISDNLLPDGKFPDYLSHAALKTGLSPSSIAASRVAEAWALYGLTTFVASLGVADDNSLRYVWFLESRLDVLANEVVNQSIVREPSNIAHLETQSIIYFTLALAEKVYSKDYSAARQANLAAVNAFWKVSGEFESTMGPDSLFNYSPPNAEAQLYGSLVLNAENDPHLIDAFRFLDFEYQTRTDDISGISFLSSYVGKIRYDLTALFALLLQNMKRTASANILHTRLSDLFSRTQGMPHANYDGGKEMGYSDDLSSVAYPVQSVYAMTLLQLSISETSALFKSEVPDIYEFAIFDGGIDSVSGTETVLAGAVDGVGSNQQKIVQDV